MVLNWDALVSLSLISAMTSAIGRECLGDGRLDPVKKKITSAIILALCVVITLATVVNVFGDNQDVIEKAEKAICWNVDKCKYAKTQMVRTPLGQSFTFEADGKSAEVVCRRSAIIFGEYSCEVAK